MDNITILRSIKEPLLPDGKKQTLLKRDGLEHVKHAGYESIGLSSESLPYRLIPP